MNIFNLMETIIGLGIRFRPAHNLMLKTDHPRLDTSLTLTATDI